MLQLVDSGWREVLVNGVRHDRSALSIAVPYIKVIALRYLLAEGPQNVRVMTRFNLNDFADGVSDLEALFALLRAGAQVRGVRGLHSKLYMFGSTRAVVTSANLTVAALQQNKEFGAVIHGAEHVAPCVTYFEDMWNQAGPNLTRLQVVQWTETVAKHKKSGWGSGAELALGDFGADIDSQPGEPPLPFGAGSTDTGLVIPDHLPAYVKFLGESKNRAALGVKVLDEVQDSGCHQVLAYPKGKRPRAPEGSLMFIAHLTVDKGVDDIRVFGFASSHVHEEFSDDATALEIQRRPWRETWPHYIRVYDAHFLNGTLSDGISLNELMTELKADSFASTQSNRAENLAASGGKKLNENPRQSYGRQPSVELSKEGRDWLAARLMDAFHRLGEIPASQLAAIA